MPGRKRKRANSATAAAESVASAASDAPTAAMAGTDAIRAAVRAGAAVRRRRARSRRATNRYGRDPKEYTRRRQQQQRDTAKLTAVLAAIAAGSAAGSISAAVRAIDDAAGLSSSSSSSDDSSSDAAPSSSDGAGSDSDDDGGSSTVDASSGAGGSSASGSGSGGSAATTTTQSLSAVARLHARAKKLTIFEKGTILTSTHKKVVMLLTLQHMRRRLLQNRHNPLSGAATAVSKALMCGTRTVRTIWAEYDRDGVGLMAADHTEMASNTRNSVTGRRVEVSTEAIETARTFVHESLMAGRTATWGEVQRFVEEKHPAISAVSEYAFRRRMMEAGFGSLRTRVGAAVDLYEEYWLRQKERFILTLSWALEEERKGNAVVLYQDESFINLRHQRTRTVVDLNDSRDSVANRRGAQRALVRSGSGRGSLLIIVHCITRDGVLEVRDTTSGAVVRTAELVYSSGTETPADSEATASGSKQRELYHRHWNRDSMMLWVRDKLFPCARARYGTDKRFILVLDNSGNHSAKADGFVSASKASSKPMLADALRRGGVVSLEVLRRSADVRASRFDTRGGKKRLASATASASASAASASAASASASKSASAATSTDSKNDTLALPPGMELVRIKCEDWLQLPPRGVSQAELIASLQSLYDTKPALATSQLEEYFRSGGPPLPNGKPDQQNYHTILWTVPYLSECNPIESQWAVAKNYAASKHHSKLSPKTLRQNLLEGLNGDGNVHDGVTAESCTASIEHSIDAVNQWIEHLPRLQALFAAGGCTRPYDLRQLTDPMRHSYGPMAAVHRRRYKRHATANDGGSSDSGGSDSDDPAAEGAIDLSTTKSDTPIH